MKKGEIERKTVMEKLEEWIKKKSDEPAQGVDVFEAMNRIHFIIQNVMSVIRFYNGPFKFTIGWLDRIDRTIRQHLTSQGMLMKRGMATSRLCMSPDNMGIGLTSSVAVYILELVRFPLQYKWAPYSDMNGSGDGRNDQKETAKAFGCERLKRYSSDLMPPWNG